MTIAFFNRFRNIPQITGRPHNFSRTGLIFKAGLLGIRCCGLSQFFIAGNISGILNAKSIGKGCIQYFYLELNNQIIARLQISVIRNPHNLPSVAFVRINGKSIVALRNLTSLFSFNLSRTIDKFCSKWKRINQNRIRHVSLGAFQIADTDRIGQDVVIIIHRICFFRINSLIHRNHGYIRIVYRNLNIILTLFYNRFSRYLSFAIRFQVI